jgi:hypothetical protein
MIAAEVYVMHDTSLSWQTIPHRAVKLLRFKNENNAAFLSMVCQVIWWLDTV